MSLTANCPRSARSGLARYHFVRGHSSHPNAVDWNEEPGKATGMQTWNTCPHRVAVRPSRGHEPRYAPHFRRRIHPRGCLPWAVPPTYAEVTVSERKRTSRLMVPNLRQHFLPVVVSVVSQYLTPLVGRVGDAFVEPRLPSAQP